MIYFIQAGDNGPVKIGYSINPEKRLQALQTSHPQKLRMITVIDGDRDLEKELHEYFSDESVSGEWFNIDMRAILAALMRLDLLSKPRPDLKPQIDRLMAAWLEYLSALNELCDYIPSAKIEFIRVSSQIRDIRLPWVIHQTKVKRGKL